MANIRIYCQKDAAEIEGLLYTILSEELFKNHRFHMIDRIYDYTIYNYVSQNFVIPIGETMTNLTCHKNKIPKV